MLCLTRREGERIKIGEGDSAVWVEVLWIKGDRVRIGVEAPPFIPVHRQEVVTRIEAEAKAKADAEAAAKARCA